MNSSLERIVFGLVSGMIAFGLGLMVGNLPKEEAKAEQICDLSGLKLKSIALTGDQFDFVVMGIKEHLYRRGVTIDQENGLEIVGSVLWPEVASVEIIGKPFASTVTGPGSYALGEAIVNNLCACKDRVLPPQSAEE